MIFMRAYTHTALLFALMTTLTACGNFQFTHYIADQNKQYINAQAAPPLVIPAKLNSDALSSKQKTLPTLPASDANIGVPSLVPPGSLSAQLQAGQIPATVLKTPLPDPS